MVSREPKFHPAGDAVARLQNVQSDSVPQEGRLARTSMGNSGTTTWSAPIIRLCKGLCQMTGDAIHDMQFLYEPIDAAFRRKTVERLIENGLTTAEALELFDANDIEDDMTPEEFGDYLVRGFRGGDE
jgi:hypothetical protein